LTGTIKTLDGDGRVVRSLPAEEVRQAVLARAGIELWTPKGPSEKALTAREKKLKRARLAKKREKRRLARVAGMARRSGGGVGGRPLTGSAEIRKGSGGNRYWYARIVRADGRDRTIRLAPVEAMSKDEAIAITRQKQKEELGS